MPTCNPLICRRATVGNADRVAWSGAMLGTSVLRCAHLEYCAASGIWVDFNHAL